MLLYKVNVLLPRFMLCYPGSDGIILFKDFSSKVKVLSPVLRLDCVHCINWLNQGYQD